MLKNTFFLLFLLTTFALYAQFIDTNPFRQLDKYALNTPEEFTYSVETLSQYLSAEALSEKEKVRAIYIWIANNIAYDDTAFFQGQRGYLHENAQHFQKQQPEQVLKNRIAVCEGYANLFKALCEKADIQAEIVTGYCKGEDGKLADMFHAWNVVKVADEWQMIDVTWGAGGLDTQNNRYIRHYNDRYFLQDKKYFLLSHFPHDPLWQLSNSLVTEAEFAEEWKDKKAYQISFFNIKDSLTKWEKLAPKDKEANSAYRICHFYPYNKSGLILIYNDCIETLNSQILTTSTQLENEKELNLTDLKAVMKPLENNLRLLALYFARLDSVLEGEKKGEFGKRHKEVTFPLLNAQFALLYWRGTSSHLSIFSATAVEKLNKETLQKDMFYLQSGYEYLEKAKQQLSVADVKDSMIQAFSYYVMLNIARQSLYKGGEYLFLAKRYGNENVYEQEIAFLDTAQKYFQAYRLILAKIPPASTPSLLKQKKSDITKLFLWEKALDMDRINVENDKLVGLFAFVQLRETPAKQLVEQAERIFAEAETLFFDFEQKWIKESSFYDLPLGSDSLLKEQQLKSEYYGEKTMFYVNNCIFYLQLGTSTLAVKTEDREYLLTSEAIMATLQKIPKTYLSPSQLDSLDKRCVEYYINLFCVKMAKNERKLINETEFYKNITDLSLWNGNQEDAFLAEINALEDLYKQREIWLQKASPTQKAFLKGVHDFVIGYGYLNISTVYRNLFHLSFKNYSRENIPVIKGYLSQVLFYLEKAEEYHLLIRPDNVNYAPAIQNLEFIRENKKELTKMVKELE